jgi:hypothetical protein
MDDSRIRRRIFVAERILATYDGQANRRDVLAEMDEADFDDPVLEALFDLFQHEPAKSRVWGADAGAVSSIRRVARTLDQ